MFPTHEVRFEGLRKFGSKEAANEFFSLLSKFLRQEDIQSIHIKLREIEYEVKNG